MCTNFTNAILLFLITSLIFTNLFAQSIKIIEDEKDNAYKTAQKLYHQDKNYSEAIKHFLRFAEICEKQNWTGAGNGFEYAAICYEKTNRVFNALKTYKRSKSAYETEGQDSEANRIKRALHVLNKDIQREIRWNASNWDSWFWLSLLKFLSDYGTNPIKLLRNVLLIILVFAFVYFPYFPNKQNRLIQFSGFNPRSGVNGAFFNFKETMLISSLIFLGRNHPSAENGKTKFVVVFEALLGYLILAVFVAILVAEIIE